MTVGHEKVRGSLRSTAWPMQFQTIDNSSRSPRSARESGPRSPRSARELGPRPFSKRVFHVAEKSYIEVLANLETTDAVLKIAVTPTLVFATTLAVFFRFLHDAPETVYAAALIGVAWCLLCLLLASGKKSTTTLSWFFCVTTLIMGSFHSFMVHEIYLVHYWQAAQGRHYADVLPSELAAAYSDASMFAFNEAELDAGRSGGYLKDGVMYCAAPILHAGQQGAAVQFWAIGKDCCADHGGFECDDAWMPEAHSGLVVHDVGGLFPVWDAHYRSAIETAQSTFGFSSPESATLVRWLQDPSKVASNYWHAALAADISATVLIFVALLFSIMVCRALAGTR